MNLRINFESTQEIPDALEDVDKVVIAFPHVLGRLVDISITTTARESGRDTHREKDANSRKNDICGLESLEVRIKARL